MSAAGARERCAWAGDDPLMIRYHDEEWGVPQHDERGLFELITLEGAQAGLAWRTILRRREGYRAAFADWHLDRIAGFDHKDVRRLLADPGIVRHRAKIESTIANARAALAVRERDGSLARYLWRFVGGAPIDGRRERLKDVPAESDESRAMSRALRGDGFRFVGPTICYALMQAAGMVNDHLLSCPRHEEVKA